MSEASLTQYTRKRPHFSFRFWCTFLIQTLGGRHITPLVRARLPQEQRCVHGLEHIPANGHFVLAVNHYNGRVTLDVVAAVLQSLAQVRPDALEELLLIVGRSVRKRSGLALLAERLIRWVFRRWSTHLVRVALNNPQPSIEGLRAWRQRRQPVFVFPEGRGSLTFGQVRSGAAQWLSLFACPVLPVAVYWQHDPHGERWHVHFGKPLTWSHRSELRDAQLGLAIAALLPPDLASDWQHDLTRWRNAHKPILETA